MPSAAQIWEWIRNVTGGVVLAGVVWGFVTGRLIPAKVYDREVSRADTWEKRFLDKVDPTPGVRNAS